MKCCIVNICNGRHYPPIGERLLRSLVSVGDKAAVMQWRDDAWPPGAIECPLPFKAYCAKPFAMKYAHEVGGYDVLLWLDAAYYAVRQSDPIFQYIEETGHYTQANGFKVGEWCSDDCLKNMSLTREEAWLMDEISTSGIGLDMRRDECRHFLDEWCKYAADGVTFMAPHANNIALDVVMARGLPTRTIGHVSTDTRVMGHRHDQTVASILANRLHWKSVARPIFMDYWKQDMTVSDKTLFISRGGSP